MAEPYTVIARRFRPQSFEEVVGQEAAARSLQQAIATGRIAHAHLFSGPRGVGKTSLARIFAKALNCADGPTAKPCQQCPSCKGITEGSDLDVIEIDAASNRGIDDVRALRENVRYAPARSRFKVYIIDEAHMLSTEAFNALLKTLEEPPAHVKFVLATTEPRRLPETVRSRCQRLDFRRIGPADCVARLEQLCRKEKIKADAAVLAAIARQSRGGLRDAEGLLDQLIAYAEGGRIELADVEALTGAVNEETLGQLFRAAVAGRADEALALAHAALEAGVGPVELVEQLQEHLRELLLLKTCGRESPLLADAGHLLDRLVEEAALASTEQLLYLSRLLVEARREAREASQPRLPVEMCLLALCRARELTDLATLVGQVERLGTGGTSVAAPAVPAPAFKPQAPALKPVLRPPAGNPRPAPAGPAAPPARSTSAAPAASAAPAPPNGPLPGLEAIRSRWGEFLAALGERSQALAGYLQQGVPLRLSGRRLEVGFPPAAAFQAQMLEQPARRKAVEAALGEMLGAALEVHCAVDDALKPADASAAASPEPAGAPDGAGEEVAELEEPEAAEPPAPPSPARVAGGAAAVQNVLKAFGGRVVGRGEG